MTIGDVIRKYRKSHGMTQDEMANRLGVSAPAVNKWENNNTLPEVALLAPIARLLGITTDELLSFKEQLFYTYFRREDYEKAIQYAACFSRANPERKRKEALVYSKTNRKEEAYRAYEELIFSGYQHIQMTLNDLRVLYMEDDDHEMANKLVEVSALAAAAFEMGRYHEVCTGLDVAAWEKDIAKTAKITQDLLDTLGTTGDFTKSRLYQHMTFKAAGSELPDRLRKEMLKFFKEESCDY